MTSFAELIAPFDAGRFAAEYFGKRPLHIRRGDAARPDILDWPRFNKALAVTSYWTEESLKLYFNNRAALRDSYCDSGDTRGRAAPVNPAKVRSLIAVGASVVANHIHRVCPEVAGVVAELSDEFSARAFANVYCSFKGVQAFQTHYDLHDVFAYQAEGEKVWRIYEARADAPVAPTPPGDEAEQWLIKTRGRLLFEADMKPGDVLYLPRGQYHDALTGARASLHVTFGVSPATGLSVLKLLEAAAAQEGMYRAYLPDGADEGSLRERLANLAERTKELMQSPAFAIEVRNHQRSLRSPDVTFDLPNREPPVWYALARNAQVQRRDSGFMLVFQGGEFDLGDDSAAVEWMVKQGRFSIQEASSLYGGSRRGDIQTVVDRLVEAGVLARTELA